MDPSLKMSHERRLVMTFALRQALEILQMPQQELALWLRAEIERNPLLEFDERSSSSPPPRDFPSKPTLYESLLQQVNENFNSPLERRIAKELLEQVDEKGFLNTRIEPIALLFQKTLPEIEKIISILQTFDPPGICACNLQETLLIQLKRQGKENTPPYTLIQNHFEDLLHGRYAPIKQKIKDLPQALKILSRLQFRPAEAYKETVAQVVVPELRIAKVEKGWTLELLEGELPKFHFQSEYFAITPETPEEKETLGAFKTSAKWISRSLARRRKLLLDIGKALLKKQALYLADRGPLAPVTIKELTEELHVHESTLSRALAGKYVETPRGILPLRSLVSSTPTTQSAREHLEKIIADEDKQSPFTDEELSQKLKSLGFPVARRTIAKYRTQLKIGSATRRKHRG